MSCCAGDSDDWKCYHINCFVDRDMLMHYHFGLGIGHVYSHTQPSTSGSIMESSNNDTEHPGDSLDSGHADLDSVTSSSDGSDPESDEELDSESVLGYFSDMDGWDGSDSDTVVNEYEF
ncbi:hypothetical protein L210DRAFT_3645184 [Boletus edulis BED1]|uniref:Uncharacterized protein n=1 Tax=Boletus edulis BED1 TaxID=1328754 RepID=A0AAD4GF64_BOLED|nr:hypothetical protein L210DRAFT_3645184 [Boletus edulis BED1]